MVDLPHTRSQKIDWINLHGTHRQKGVTRLLPIASQANDAIGRWRRVGEIFRAVVGHAFDTDQPLRPDGSRWSLSAIGKPHKLALSLAAHDVAHAVPESWRSAAYGAELEATGRTPMLVSGSMKIHRLNRVLAMSELALPTSGASDGQTIAGACATGTHGAAVRFGAIHDALRAVHLMVAPDKTLLVQPKGRPLLSQAARSLGHWLDIACKPVADDDLFRAAQVHLGSLGLVLNVVLEAEPLYFLAMARTPHRDDAWKDVLRTGDASGLPGHAADADDQSVLLLPYPPEPSDRPVAWTISMKKHRFTGQSGVDVTPGTGGLTNPDLVGIIGWLGDLLDGTLTEKAIRRRITKEIVDRYGVEHETKRALPGAMFGPTALPERAGESMELVVDAADVLVATETVLRTLREKLGRGEQFFGAVSARYVAGSDALLAPNARAVSCFIELPGVRNRETTGIYEACARALGDRGISTGVHWGQYLPARLKTMMNGWWGSARIDDWKQARRALLPSAKARRVFGSRILAPAGLE